MRHAASLAVLFTAAISSIGPDRAAAAAPIQLTVRNHHTSRPTPSSAPAGQRFILQVRNLDPTPEEFESYDFKVEKIMAPHATIIVPIGPLKPGLYNFFGDYNPSLAKGVLRVVPAGTGK